MADLAEITGAGAAIAIVGLSCRYPEADDPPALLDLALTGRRAFRRIPPGRLDLADYYSPDPQTPDATYSTRAALIEGWQFDPRALQLPDPEPGGIDPAHGLALETAARALAAAGFPGGSGLPGDRSGAIIGSAPAGDFARTSVLRMRWPYARRMLAQALFSAGIPGEQARQILRSAAAQYLAPLAGISEHTLDRGSPGAMASAIAGQFGFRGGGYSVDGGGASSLVAVSTACMALAAGELDVAIAGGVDLSLDPLELAGMAKAGLLASGDMAVYDQHPTGFLPGEGCGMVLLMRSADALAAQLPVYAEILGWGVASTGLPGQPRADQAGEVAVAQGQLLALTDAYRKSGIDPADVQLIEGGGAGVGTDEAAELRALTLLRVGTRRSAALGSIAANIGNTRAAAGVAGLIKTVLAISSGVLPPTAGVRAPHPILREPGTGLRLPACPEPWPDGDRLAGVSAVGPGGLNVHLVLRGRHARSQRVAGSRPAAATRRPAAYLLHAPDRPALAGVLSRIATVAPWLSDGEMDDLASQLTAAAAKQGPVRVAIVATRQEQLARLAAEAITMLPGLTGGLLAVQPGIFAADGASGRVTVLLPDPQPHGADRRTDDGSGSGLGAILAALDWLDALGVAATAAVGHGTGELAGLVWAGCTTAARARALAGRNLTELARAEPAQAEPAQAELARAEPASEFAPPRRRLISCSTGGELSGPAGIAAMLLAGAGSAAALSSAVLAGADGADLLVETGPGRTLVTIAAQLCGVPAVSLDDGPGNHRHAARVAAALFAAGALTRPEPLTAGRPARPIDIWRDRIFITSPCQAAAQPAWTTQAPLDAPVSSDHSEARQPRSAQSHPAPNHISAARNISPAGSSVTGIAPWWRCYAEQLQELRDPIPSGNDRPWRLYIAGCEPLRLRISELFRHDHAAGRTLAILGNLDDPRTSEAALAAARDAIGSGLLVAISSEPALTGLWASLHAEHPALGITAVRAPLTADGIQAARQLAACAPGEYRELVIGADGGVTQPVMMPVPLSGGGQFPFGQDDVVLASRGAGAALLPLAQVLACSGAALVIIGPEDAESDGELIAALDRLGSAGARVSYELVDPAQPGAVTAAVQRVGSRTGPVTAVVYAAGQVPRLPVSALPAAELRKHLRRQAALLDCLVDAIRPGPAGACQLRFIITFGSVAGRYPVATQGILATASGMLAARGERLAASLPGCRALHLDWPAWAGASLGERADLAASMEQSGVIPMPIAEGARQLFKVLAAGPQPGRLAVHGRVGLPAPPAIAACAPAGRRSAGRRQAGRFAEQVLAHYPGVELILQASLSLSADPYLADYQLDATPVLPPTMALEALAEAASVLAGRPIRTASHVTATAPIVLPAGKAGSSVLVRICALRAAELVTAVLRCETSGFRVDHYRAVFSYHEAGRPAWPSHPVPARDPLAEVADGSELYGPVWFQTGRFRRLATIGPVTAHAAIAVADGMDELPWFGPAGQAGQVARSRDLLLGSAGLSDATLQVVQACVPHRRLRFAGCESVTFSGSAPVGAVTIRATETMPADTMPADTMPSATMLAGTTAVDTPSRAGGTDRAETAETAETVWDVEATDAAGQPVITWRRLLMADAGPLQQAGPWPVPLLAGYLARVAAELGLGPGLEVQVRRQPVAGERPFPPAAVPSQAASPEQGQGQGQRQRQGQGQRTGGASWVQAPSGDNELADLDLAVRAAGPAACGWQTAAPDCDAGASHIPEHAAIAACLQIASVPDGLTVHDSRRTADGWLVLHAAEATIACTVLRVAGVSSPVAIALMTGALCPASRPAARPQPRSQPASEPAPARTPRTASRT